MLGELLLLFLLLLMSFMKCEFCYAANVPYQLLLALQFVTRN